MVSGAKGAFLFDQLPTDISQVIYSDWLADMKTLVSLDISCTNHSLRSALHESFHGFVSLLANDTLPAKKSVKLGYFKWLHDRNMLSHGELKIKIENLASILPYRALFGKVKSVTFLTDKSTPPTPPPTRPTIVTVPPETVKEFFKACSEITSLTLLGSGFDTGLVKMVLECTAHLHLDSFVFPDLLGTSNDAVVAMVAQWKRTLKCVDVSAVGGLTDVSLQALGVVNGLEAVYLPSSKQQCTFTADGFQHMLSGLESVKVLDFHKNCDDNRLTAVMQALSTVATQRKCLNLESLVLPNVYNASKVYQFLADFFPNCPRLTAVAAGDVFNLSVNDLGQHQLTVDTYIPDHVDELLAVDLPVKIEAFATKETDENILNGILGKYGEQLLTLEIESHWAAAVVQCIVAKCPHLTACRFISEPEEGSDISAQSWDLLAAAYGKQLKVLWIRQSSITDATLAKVLKKFPFVEELSLESSWMLSTKAVANLLKQYPTLQRLSVAYHENMDGIAVANAIVKSTRLQDPFMLFWREMRWDAEAMLAVIDKALDGKPNKWRQCLVKSV